MAMRKTTSYKPIPPVYLSQLDGIGVLWPDDVRTLAEFMLRCHDARDKIENAKKKRLYSEIAANSSFSGI